MAPRVGSMERRYQRTPSLRLHHGSDDECSPVVSGSTRAGIRILQLISSYVAILDIALVLVIFKGDLKLS
jgi:hypothetical protein